MRALTCIPLFAAALAVQSAGAAEMAVAVEVPRLEVAEYHRPYVAVWIEREDQTVAANLSIWYEVGNRKEGTKWLADLRQWWRRDGRNQTFPIDGVTGPTKPVGTHQLRFDGRKEPLASLAPGKYRLVVEAARETGGREVLRVPFEWPAKSAQALSARGSSELGTVALNLAP
jgi:hypothetical protein